MKLVFLASLALSAAAVRGHKMGECRADCDRNRDCQSGLLCADKRANSNALARAGLSRDFAYCQGNYGWRDEVCYDPDVAEGCPPCWDPNYFIDTVKPYLDATYPGWDCDGKVTEIPFEGDTYYDGYLNCGVTIDDEFRGLSVYISVNGSSMGGVQQTVTGLECGVFADDPNESDPEVSGDIDLETSRKCAKQMTYYMNNLD